MKDREHNSEMEVIRREFDFPFEEPPDPRARERRIARLRLLWGQRKFLIRVAAYGLLAAALLAFLIPKQYQSHAQLMPPDQLNTSAAMLAALSSRTGGLGGMAGDLLGVKSSGALFVGILQSRTVQDRLIEQFDLKDVYGAGRIEDARGALAERTSIGEDRKSGIISIAVRDRDPQRAAALAGAYVSELNRLVAEVSTSSARREREFLEQRLEVVNKELDEAAREFSQFASKNTTIDLKEQGRAMVEAAATLQGQLIVAQTELEVLKQTFTDQNVRVRSAQARVDELQRQLEKLGGLEAGPGSGTGEKQALYPSIRQLPLLGVTYAELYRRTKIAEVVFELLTQQYELAKVQEAKEIPSVKVLDAPVTSSKKSFPPRLLIMAAGTLLSFAFGIAWVLGNMTWSEVDSADSGKTLAHEVWTTVQTGITNLPHNGWRTRRLGGSEAGKDNESRPGDGHTKPPSAQN